MVDEYNLCVQMISLFNPASKQTQTQSLEDRTIITLRT